MYSKYIENFLREDECNFLIQLGEQTGLQKMKSSKFFNGVYVETALNEDTNKRMGCYFGEEMLNLSEIKQLSEKIIDKLNDLKPFNGIKYINVPKYSFNRYSQGDFLDWHADSHEILYGATSTVILQLNDDYEGGDIKYIIDGEEKIVPKKTGSIFIFDSNIQHSVSTVENGNRYSLNVWPTKQIKKELI